MKGVQERTLKEFGITTNDIKERATHTVDHVKMNVNIAKL